MNVTNFVRTAVSTACLLSASSLAFAHATLEVKQASPKSSYKAIMRIGHGCEGSPTLKVRIQVPEGYVNVKPMPKAGWTMETVVGKYAKEYDTGHAKISQGVKEVIWTGKLLDAHYDEFVLTGTIDGGIAPNTTMWFPTVQECEKGFNRWIEIPAAGKSSGDYKEPAPGLRIVAPN
jgi:uncharacterized protein YcnI